jgi:hypothetical protein
MPVSIDEVSAEISPEPRNQQGQAAEQTASEAAESRRHRDCLERIEQRARRVKAD